MKMANDSSSDVIQHIKRNHIFKTFLEELGEDSDSKVLDKNKIAVWKDYYVFFSVGTSVRFAALDGSSDSYMILKRKIECFEILNISINMSGTFLALVGESKVEIIPLPKASSSLEPNTTIRSYILEGLSGSIIKTTWQPAIADDSNFLILNDMSQIFAYGISVSYLEPQITLSLKQFEKFKSEDATSITFGSTKVLSGMLSLYIGTASGSAYVIYPFIQHYTKIAATREQVEQFLDDTRSSLELVDRGYPSLDGNLNHKDSIKNALSIQYKYALHLKEQMEFGVLQKEYRPSWNAKLKDMYIFSSALSEDFKLTLQGPLCSVPDSAFIDLISIECDGNTTVLVSLLQNSVNNSFELLYFAQLTSLIMRFEAKIDLKSQNNERKTLHNKSVAKNSGRYVRVKKGFGYIDPNEEEPEEQEQEEDADSESYGKQKFSEISEQFWDVEINKLSKIKIDRFPHVKGPKNECRLIAMPTSNHSFIVKLMGYVVLCDYSSLFREMNYTMESIKLPLQYRMMSRGNESINSLAVVFDIFNMSNILLILRKSKLDTLTIIPLISINGSNIELSHDAAEKRSENQRNASYQPLIKLEPFEEISKLLDKAKNVCDPATYKSKLGVKSEQYSRLIRPDIEDLQLLNKLSQIFIKCAMDQMTLAFHLNFRFKLQINELTTQIEQINTFKDKSESFKDFVDKERSEKILMKQKKIETRITNLTDKLSKALKQIHDERNLPLSEAEKKWFKELNSMITQVNKTEDEKNLANRISKLQAQVKYLKLAKQSRCDQQDPISDSLRDINLYNHINKIKHWLDEEGMIISTVKAKLDKNLSTYQ